MSIASAEPHAAFAAALAQAEGQPSAGFAALHRLADALVGARIFTVLVFDFPANKVVRAYSSEEGLYPTHATDAIYDTIWERTLIGAKQPLVLNDYAALSSLLPEVDKLRQAGCEAMLNVPVVIGGEVLGALNMLHDNGRYDAARIEAAKALAPGAAALLLKAWQPA